MSRLLTIASFLLLVTGLVQAQAPKPTSGATPPSGKIFCARPAFDFGEACQNDQVIHIFKLENKGAKDLKILGVQPSCNCTSAPLERDLIKPGESLDIKATMNTLTFEGLVTKTLDVRSDDPEMPSLHLSITGRVTAAFKPTITEVNFGRVRKGQTTDVQKFDIHVGQAVKGDIRDVRADYSQVKATITPVEGASGARLYNVAVRIEGDLPVGSLRANLTFTTSLTAQSVINVPVVALVEGEVNVTPRTFNFGNVTPGGDTVKEVVVDKTGNPDLKVTGVKIEPADAFTTEVVETKSGASWKVLIRPGKELKKGYQRATLEITTNCKGEESLKVYFYAFCK